MSTDTAEFKLEMINAAFRRAAVKVVALARRTGTPIIVWEDGRIVERRPEDYDDAEWMKSPEPVWNCGDSPPLPAPEP